MVRVALQYATQLELAVFAKEEQPAADAAAQALAVVRERETTARNLRLIREARERRHESLLWADQIEEEFQRLADK